uniref:Phosphatidylinositol phosphatase PTPRQ-like n=1 Tax=Saccoglossus kowalevskii TaxID=10224 RepID=A0ABM0MKX5_SACKO|nr:PREDICTED: phosphatidylinositol phosphatase PTPRQ-like [Saccoglossus kowalevskii]
MSIIQRSTSYLLCNLESFTEYTIKVKASETFLDLDSEYWSDWSSSTTAITAEGAPLTQLHLDHDIKRNPEFENKMDVILTWDPLSVRDMRGVVLGYNVTVVEATQQLLKNTALTNATTYRVIGLDIYSTYEIHVVTYNSVGSSPDASVTVSFPASAPSPPTLVTAKALSASNIHIRWNPSPSMNTDITSYTIYWSSSDSHTRHYNFTNVDGDLEYTVTNLLAYTRYEFYITASNVVGEGGQSLPVYEYTLEAVPTSSPRDVEMNTIEENPTRLSVRWRSPCLSNQNGIILGYLVYYCPLLNTSQCDGVEVINVTATDLENRVLTQWYLDNLKPYTYYKVIIAAYNSIGIGPNSTEVYNRTSQGAPSKPIRPVVTDITAVNMTVHWEPPIIPNGNIIKYEVKYNEDKVTTYTTSVVLEDLSGYTEYDIQIQACSEAVINPCGDFASLNKRTDIGVPGQMSAPVAKVTDVNTVNILCSAFSTEWSIRIHGLPNI